MSYFQVISQVWKFENHCDIFTRFSQFKSCYIRMYSLLILIHRCMYVYVGSLAVVMPLCSGLLRFFLDEKINVLIAPHLPNNGPFLLHLSCETRNNANFTVKFNLKIEKICYTTEAFFAVKFAWSFAEILATWFGAWKWFVKIAFAARYQQKNSWSVQVKYFYDVS